MPSAGKNAEKRAPPSERGIQDVTLHGKRLGNVSPRQSRGTQDQRFPPRHSAGRNGSGRPRPRCRQVVGARRALTCTRGGKCPWVARGDRTHRHRFSGCLVRGERGASTALAGTFRGASVLNLSILMMGVHRQQFTSKLHTCTGRPV